MRARGVDFVAGDIGCVPRDLAHCIENIGDEPARALNVFSMGDQRDVSLDDWPALARPPDVVRGHLDVDDTLMQALRQSPGSVVEG